MRFFGVVVGVFALFYLLDLALLCRAHRPWWCHHWVRRVAIIVPVVAAPAVGIWALGYAIESPRWIVAGAAVTSILFVHLVALLPGLLVAAVLRQGGAAVSALRCRWLQRHGASGALVPFPAPPPPPEALAGADVQPARPDRRRFLQTALAAVPAATVTAGAGGVVGSVATPRLPEIPLAYPDLPADLRGLRLLHLTDLHVGTYLGLEDLADLVERATRLDPDLVVVTGDICDHLPIFDDTLRLLEQLQPPLGAYASLGNHEYFRGIEAVRAAFGRSTIPLLVDAGTTCTVGAARLRLAGADDPRFMNARGRAHLRASVERCLDGADSDAFHLLLSHRSQSTLR